MNELWRRARAFARVAIRRAEGLELKRYKCPAGKWTIGYGHLITPGEADFHDGISTRKADSLLARDIQDAELIVGAQYGKALEAGALNAERLAVLIEMAFCLGSRGLVRFVSVRLAVMSKNFPWAAAEIQNSRWFWEQGAKDGCKGIRTRVLRLKRQMRSGKVQNVES